MLPVLRAAHAGRRFRGERKKEIHHGGAEDAEKMTEKSTAET
jgi:hypothetical protein